MAADIDPALISGNAGDLIASVSDGARAWTAAGADRPTLQVAGGRNVIRLAGSKLTAANSFAVGTIAAVVNITSDVFLAGFVGYGEDFGLRLVNDSNSPPTMQKWMGTGGTAGTDFANGAAFEVNGVASNAYGAVPHVIVATSAAARTGAWTLGGYFPYGGRKFAGDTYRLIQYAGILDATNRAALAAALKKKYGIA